jgi:hypothetical protein
MRLPGTHVPLLTLINEVGLLLLLLDRTVSGSQETGTL